MSSEGQQLDLGRARASRGGPRAGGYLSEIDSNVPSHLEGEFLDDRLTELFKLGLGDTRPRVKRERKISSSLV